jgi:guanylate kinase
VERVLDSGRHVLLDIEVQGARNVRRLYPQPQSVTIFVLPPTAEAWLERLRRRRTESQVGLARRLSRAKYELGELQGLGFDHVVINDELDPAVEQVKAIVEHPSTAPARGADGGKFDGLVAGLIAEADRHLHVLKTEEQADANRDTR